MIFDGKKFAGGIEQEIKVKVAGMDRKPKLVTFYDANDIGSRVYTNVKEKKAGELGILFEKILNSNVEDPNKLKILISQLNRDPSVDGVMVQLPMEGSRELIEAIDPDKDVDGLREDSPFMPATVRAVMEILKTSPFSFPSPNFSRSSWLRRRRGAGGEVVVVGNKGMVGKKLVKILSAQCSVLGMDKDDFNSDLLKTADFIISATGQAGLIKPEMIKAGAVCIDVGYPRGDFDPEVAMNASFLTPVPGGVGPVTVEMLFANLVGL
jgi:methylenetetrahydrofolate dehydrogenase (NADP+) / methenyltetrahydrofolate cyclohydrolase